jgi:phosphate transport system protein
VVGVVTPDLAAGGLLRYNPAVSGDQDAMDTSGLSHHILSRYNEDLEGVRSGVLQMGGLVEQQLQNGVRAIVTGDARLGEEVARFDHKVNAMEVAIDDDCSRILATRGPTASDLRLIVAVIKTITDLERIGDEAEKLGQAASRFTSVERPAERYRELKHIGELVTDMVHGALDAFARLDTEAALQVARRDRVVDEEYDAIQRQCITFMMEDPRTIRRTLDIMSIARALERIGDHAKNICEYVVFMVLGKDIRHLSIEDVERHVSAARASRSAAAPAQD